MKNVQPTDSIVEKGITKEQFEQEQVQEFGKKYHALCEKYGYQIVVSPAYKFSNDTGTFSTVLQPSIGKMPKAE